MKTTIKLLCIWVLIFLAGCDVKDPIYNTDHPEMGKLPLLRTGAPVLPG